jgi:hypothetical protein
MFEPLWASVTTSGVGAAAWLVVSLAGGRREAWDSPLYFLYALPVIAVTAAIVSYKAPARAWRWAMFPFWSQAVVAFVQDPTANLLPLGLIVFSIFGAVCLIPATIGATAGRKAAP